MPDPTPTYARLEWDKTGERFYETGVEKGVLWVWDKTLNDGAGGWADGVAWNGLTNVSEKPSGAEPTALYADDIKYLNLISNEEFAATIEAYTYPDEFAACDGSAQLTAGLSIGQQTRTKFCFCYQTKIGNDTEGNDKGVKYHIVYNCLAAPTEKGYATINDSPEAITFSWEISTTPVDVTDYKPTAIVTIDSTKLTDAQITALEAALYGNASGPSTLKTPDQLKTILTGALSNQTPPPAEGDGETNGETNGETTGQG